MRHKITIILIVMGVSVGYAQDPQFTQFFAASAYLNPAFAGATFQNRAAMTYRNQWPGVPKAFNSMNAAVDMNFNKINTGVGVNLYNDNAGTGGLKTTNFSLQVAHQFKLKRDLYVRPAIQYGLIHKRIDFADLTFGDQLVRNGAPNTIEQNTYQPITNFDFGAGFLLYSSTKWVGFAIHHLNKPNESLLGYEAPLPMKFSLHGGYKLYVNDIIRTASASDEMNFAFNYKAQGKFDQFDVGFYYYRSPMMFGVWYRGIPGLKAYQPGYQNNDAIALLIGAEFKNFKVGYSYDITISRLVSNTTGSHEISIIYNWAAKDSPPLNQQLRKVPCPKF
ncbi:MAG: type IX secretion system membrane protein PorP/SprF [Flavobacteriales bacterium]|nr:type IX secretion system membrane protein PorP/SprF [Flavobacteriales bacterium]